MIACGNAQAGPEVVNDGPDIERSEVGPDFGQW